MSSHFVGGELVYLVQPQHIGTKWTQDNKHDAVVVVVNYEGEIVGHDWFPESLPTGVRILNIFPVPTSLNALQM
jgi:hypothetical protein